MEFLKEVSLKGAFIPRSALTLSGFAEKEEAELHALPGAAILLKKRMTALELLQAVDALSKTSTSLLTELAGVCGPCEDCAECPYDCSVQESVTLPEHLRQEAGIALDAKLCADANEETQTVTIYAAQHRHDLSDIPEDLFPLLHELGLCMGALEEKIIHEEVVHDG